MKGFAKKGAVVVTGMLHNMEVKCDLLCQKNKHDLLCGKNYFS